MHSASGSPAQEAMIRSVASGSVASRGGAEASGEQVPCFGVGERAEGQWAGAVGDGETGEPVAAGDDDPAVAGAGQQWTDLRCVACVVQDDEHPLSGQQAAQQAQLCLCCRRQSVGWYPECVEEYPGRFLGCQRSA